MCYVLHNFAQDRDGIQTEDTLMVEGLLDMELAAGQLQDLLAICETNMQATLSVTRVHFHGNQNICRQCVGGGLGLLL